MRNYRDLIAWQRAMDLADRVYTLTETFPQREQFILSSQLRRSALSVASNIAEGSGRLSSGEWMQFLGQSRGSLYEAQTQLILAGRRGFGDAEELSRLIELTDEVSRIINGLMRSASRRFAAKKFGDVIRDSGGESDERWFNQLPLAEFATSPEADFRMRTDPE